MARERRGHRARRREAAARRPSPSSPRDELVELGAATVGANVAEARRLLEDDLGEHRERGRRRERRLPVRHSKSTQPSEKTSARASMCSLAARLLGRHVARACRSRSPVARQRRRSRARARAMPKSRSLTRGDPGRAADEEDVRRLDVAVDDARRRGARRARARSARDARRSGHRQRPRRAAAPASPRPRATPWRGTGVPLASRRARRSGPRARPSAREEPRLAREALDGDGVVDVGVEPLDRDEHALLAIARAEDLAPRAATDALEELEPLVDDRCCRGFQGQGVKAYTAPEPPT